MSDAYKRRTPHNRNSTTFAGININNIKRKRTRHNNTETRAKLAYKTYLKRQHNMYGPIPNVSPSNFGVGNYKNAFESGGTFPPSLPPYISYLKRANTRNTRKRVNARARARARAGAGAGAKAGAGAEE